jgi:hypothetical protein
MLLQVGLLLSFILAQEFLNTMRQGSQSLVLEGADSSAAAQGTGNTTKQTATQRAPGAG